MRICKTCGLEKKEIAFQNLTTLTCKKCNIKKQVEKSRKFSNSLSLGLNSLSKTGGINVLHKYLRPNMITNYRTVMKILETSKIPYVVYNQNTIYLKKFIVPEREDILLRINVIERDNYTCRYCNGDADTVDHIVPKSKGGQFTWKNLVACCSKCNELKKDEFINIRDMREIVLEEKIATITAKKNKWE